MEITWVHKALTSPTGIKYEFGIRRNQEGYPFRKGNGNNLWEEAIKTELEQLSDYKTFIVFDSRRKYQWGFNLMSYVTVLISLQVPSVPIPRGSVKVQEQGI
jgi:hypothetical protein